MPGSIPMSSSSRIMIHPKRLAIGISVFLVCSFLSVWIFKVTYALVFNAIVDLVAPYDISKDLELEHLYHIPYPIIQKSENPVNISAERIAIVMVLAEGVKRSFYRISIDSMECYAKAHGYQSILTSDTNWGCDHLEDKFFRRHCVIAKILPKYDAVLHLDADIGVVNPRRKLEDFLDANIDIIFYDRHYNQEIATGSYFARNTQYAVGLIEEFANYESKLPIGMSHGSDNGAIHIFLAEKLFPHSAIELELCRKSWRHSITIIDQFSYTSCVRTILGSGTDFGKIRILRKGTSHVRDNWLTSGIWSPERDFMFHGYKMHQLAEVPKEQIFPVQMSYEHWYNPFLGDFDLDRCRLGNTTWNHNEKFIGTREAVEYELRKFEVKKAMQKMELLQSLHNLVINGRDRHLIQPVLEDLFPYEKV
ncbi:unnamed protein product [Caenorhabditis brenneri]